MSTTFGIKIPSLYEDNVVVMEEVAFRSGNGVRWLNPLAQMLPDFMHVEAIDNSPQGVYTIGDLKKLINK